MDVAVVRGLARAEHGGEAAAGALSQSGAQVLRLIHIRRRDNSFVGEHQRVQIDRQTVRVLAHFAVHGAIAEPALVSVVLLQGDKSAADRCEFGGDFAAHPGRQRLRHFAAQRSGRLHRHLLAVSEANGGEREQILRATLAGTCDVWLQHEDGDVGKLPVAIGRRSVRRLHRDLRRLGNSGTRPRQRHVCSLQCCGHRGGQDQHHLSVPVLS
jgi:hypothetical protein